MIQRGRLTPDPRTSKGKGRAHGGQLIDKTDVVSHIEWLMSIGMTGTMIARAAGVAARTVQFVLSDWTFSIREETAEAILSVTPRPVPAQSFVLSYGMIRRAQALATMGWSQPKIVARLGTSIRVLYPNKHPRCCWELHEAMAGLYNEWSGVDGGDIQVKRWAADNGFAPPALWDDIDDFHEQPALTDIIGYDWQTKRARVIARRRAQVQRALTGELRLTVVQLAARHHVTISAIHSDIHHIRNNSPTPLPRQLLPAATLARLADARAVVTGESAATVPELAAKHGVTERQITRDKATIRKQLETR